MESAVTAHPFSVTLKDDSASCRCYGLAVDGGVVRYALLAGPVNEVDTAQQLMADHGLVTCNGQHYQGAYLPTVLRRALPGYGDAAVLALRSADRRYLWSLRTDELYHALLTLYPTPLLPEWATWLQAQLIEKGNLARISVYGDHAYRIDLSAARLEEIVGHGLRSQRLTIPDALRSA